MKHCNHCKVDVDTAENYCPLCYNYFEGGEDPETEYYLKREHAPRTMKSNHFVAKLFFFISLCVSVICVAINIFAGKQSQWSPIVICSIVYLWILVAHNIMSSRSAFEKVFFQLLGLLLLLYSLERISKGDWLFSYVLPSIILAATSVLAMISLISKSKANFLLSFFIFYIIFFVVSLVFLIFVKDVYRLLYLISVFYTGLIAAGTLIFGNKILRAEITKKAHL